MTFLAAGRTNVRGASAGNSNLAPGLVEHVKRAVVVVNTFDAKDRLISQGSGFFIDRGRIITNLHVVGRASRVEIVTFAGETLSVEGAVAFDGGRDLAILQASHPAREVAPLTPADQLPREGEEIFVVSNPRGSFWEVSQGRTLAPWFSPELGRLVPITAPVMRGSSGGPVVNLRGHVVGVATMGMRTNIDHFFAVPAEHVASLRLRPRILMPFPLQTAD